MKPLILIAVLTVCLFAIGCEKCSAQLFARPQVVGFNWDSECAIQSALTYQACRQNGGNNWRCLVNAGFDYWSCSGSTFEMSDNRVRRVRAAMLGARVVRRGR